VEISTSELTPKDFDTYQPIKGVSKSTTGVRATGRDKSKAYFDAVEKGQYFDLNGLKANTSLKLIGELLSKSNKAIIIPKGQDDYGRDLNDIYLQDENNPNQYHALDSLGVVNREAIFGKYIYGEKDKMTDRQKMITGQAEEKGGFKYNMSPWFFRETKDYNEQNKQNQKDINYTKTENEILRTPKSKAAQVSAENYKPIVPEKIRIDRNLNRTVVYINNIPHIIYKPYKEIEGKEIIVNLDAYGTKANVLIDPKKSKIF
jgi:hypothetical protein